MQQQRLTTVSGNANLIDILDRILDKGLVIAGDIRVSLANVELLTIRIRLLVCSVDKAEEIGMNWWKHDPNLTTPGNLMLRAPTPRRAVLRQTDLRSKRKRVKRSKSGKRKR